MKNKLFKYMEIANAVSQLSKDTSTKVGAIILGNENAIRSLGYNGAPRGSRADETGDDRGVRPEKYYWFSHAEANAITNAARIGTPLDGTTLIATHFPCMDCARLIVQAGIKRVITNRPDDAFAERWGEHMDRAVHLFEECGVELQIMPPSSDQPFQEPSGCGNSEGGMSDFGTGELE